MGDWDDDDFEIDVKQLDEKKHTIVVDEEVNDRSEQNQPSHASKSAAATSSKSRKKSIKDPFDTFAGDLNRELTGKEKEELQRKADLMLAKDLFGLVQDEPLKYAELSSLDEFRTFGENVGRMLSTRSNATHFSEMIISLLKVVLSNVDASKARVLSSVLKTIADEKTAAEKKAKGKNVAAKPTIRNTGKPNASSIKGKKDLYDDYVADEYDDYADHFMFQVLFKFRDLGKNNSFIIYLFGIFSEMDEASGSGEVRRNLRNFFANRNHHETGEFETIYENIDIMQWEDDDIALCLAASKSALTSNRPTAHEMEAFPELRMNRGSVALYLYLRNKLLQMWHRNPRVELTVRDFMAELPSPYDSDPLFIRRIHEFLQRFGHINVGVFNRLTAIPKTFPKRIIVIGAGIAGIIAARQLKSFGFDVILLEARSRIGGRISTYIKPVTDDRSLQKKHQNPTVAELGASFIYGTFGNPLMTLCKQFEVICLPVCLDQCPIYDPTGKAIEPRRVRLVERAFNNIIYASTYMAHKKGITELNGRKLNLGETFSVMLKEQDYRLQTRRISYFASYENVLTKLKAVQDTMVLKKDEIVRLHTAYGELKEKEGCTDLSEDEQMENEIMLKCAIKDIDDAIQAYESLESKRREINIALAELSRNEPSTVYMNEMDKRILDFHIANLEYSIGAPIDDISLKYWNHNANSDLEGPNMYGRLLRYDDNSLVLGIFLPDF
uniref:SWIRM domain-containing protein n=1 Tax=Setaria digitata TaxID=48799 RepID=A0A915Q5U3_9BILA